MAGFSLFELLVVMAIIGLMSVLVVPQLANSLTGTQLKAASKKVAAGLRFARSRAVAEQIGYAANFDFERNRLNVHSINPKASGESQTPPEPEVEASSEPTLRFYDLPRGVRFEKAEAADGEVNSGTFEMVFFPNGSCSGGEVVLVNERDKRVHLIIDFITATVRLTVSRKNGNT